MASALCPGTGAVTVGLGTLVLAAQAVSTRAKMRGRWARGFMFAGEAFEPQDFLPRIIAAESKPKAKGTK